MCTRFDDGGGDGTCAQTDAQDLLPGSPASPASPWSWLSPSSTGEWFVLHVKSRQEKALSRDLELACIPHFLPLVREAKYYGTRKALVHRPLFPGYLFIRSSLESAYREANRSHRVAHVLRVSDQEQLDSDLRNLHLALSKRSSLDVYPFLRKGVRVVVRAGPFRGLQGVIHDLGNQNRIILQIEMLGRAASLEIDGALLDRMN